MIPKYNEMYRALLETLKDKKEYSTKEYRNKVAKLMNISDEEREILLDSDGGNKYNTALNWTSVYLKNLIELEIIEREFSIDDSFKKTYFAVAISLIILLQRLWYSLHPTKLILR